MRGAGRDKVRQFLGTALNEYYDPDGPSGQDKPKMGPESNTPTVKKPTVLQPSWL
jgi:hypothetical protein